MITRKYSKHREAIKEYLKSTNSHPTADEIYDQVRIQCPSISLGTVYRNINQLYEEGEIRRISFADSPDHYDARMDVHAHFVCRHCHKVFDVNCDMQSIADLSGISEQAGTVDGLELIYHGICKKCCL